MIAVAFMTKRNASNTSMAAEVLSTKARSGLSAQRYTWTGNAVEGSRGLLGTSTMKATIPIINNGADSPKALAIPIIVPVNMPGPDPQSCLANRRWYRSK